MNNILQDKERLKAYLNTFPEDTSLKMIAEEMNVGYSTLLKWRKIHNINEGSYFGHPNKYSYDDVIEAVNTLDNWNDILNRLNLVYHTNNIRKIKRICVKLNINTIKLNRPSSTPRYTKETALCKGSKITRAALRKFLIRNDMYDGKCNSCGIGEIWNGKSLTLQIEHINGQSNDNREENLEWLCPNCHSQTLTYGNKKRSN